MRPLKIMLVLGGKGTHLPGKSEIWIRNLHDPLVSLGHQVTLLDVDAFAERHGVRYMSQEAKELLSNELPSIFAREHAAHGFDLFFSYLQTDQVSPDVFKEIKRHVFTVNYSTNYHQFEIYEEIAKVVHLNIAIYKGARAGFERIGAKMYWMPFAGNPDFYRPGPRAEARDAVFVGSRYGHRPLYLWRAIQQDVPLRVYGPGWQLFDGPPAARPAWKRAIRSLVETTGYTISRLPLTPPNLSARIGSLDAALMDAIVADMNAQHPDLLHGPLDDQAFAARLSSAAICVNISESQLNHNFVSPQVFMGYGLRDFEATLSGSLVCTQYYNDLGEFFEMGREIEIFHDPYELADKLRYYLAHETEREKIAHAGYERAVRDHTWQRRFEGLFNFLNL